MSAPIRDDILRLLRAVAELGATARDGWVPWARVARKLEGSEEFTQLVKALADLPDAIQLFSKNERVVRLSPHGWEVYNRLAPIPPETVTIQIANAVKEYASTLTPLTFHVQSVSRGAHVGPRVVQALFVDSEETFATDTPVTFRSPSGWKTSGKVVGQEPDGAAVYLALQNEIFPDCVPGVLQVDRAFLLHSLATRLAGLPEIPPLAARLLNGAVRPPGDSLRDYDAIPLADRLAGLPTPWARFLWGPPGAGKTYGIGRLVARLLQDAPNEQHLVVAPSNRAVDVAVLQFLLHCDGASTLHAFLADRRILRFGYPRKPEVMDRPELLGPENLNELTTAVKELSRRIHEAERKQEPEERLATLRAELLTVQEELRGAIQAHIRQSAVVFTTSTLAYLSSEANPIGDIAWSSVLVDEVTMVPPAQCVFLGSLSRSRFLLAGDPRQLGPVFESHGGSSPTIEWMGRDIFEKAGISQGEGEARTIRLSDNRLARIDAQRRCCAGIWERVQTLYPHVSSGVNERDLKWLRDLPPRRGESVVLLETSALAARCERAHESWRNVVSAELAMEVACAAVGEAQQDLSIAIIAPYRAQVRLLRKWLRHEARSENPAYRRIEAGTVHQFQGSDADCVVFDVVDGVGRTELGVLLRGDVGLRLVNVAITRARGKVVIIADRTWFQRVARREHNPLLWDLVVCAETDWHLRAAPPIAASRVGGCESPIEEALLAAMREHTALAGVVTQFEVRDEGGHLVSRADFAFPHLRYAVYCDGAEWHLRPDRWQKDWRQRNKLTELGWIFTVFTGTQVKRDPGGCARQVLMTYERRTEGPER
jgi:hypothetical protein